MRNAFAQSLITLADQNKKIVLLTGDLGYTVFEDFKEKYPTRFYNMGVAEANMLGVACGMAMSGLIPVVYSIATFSSMRGYEQIRTDICLHNANVKIIGTGAGLSYGHAGPTHHAVEDIAILRVLPNITIVCASDPVSAAAATRQMIDLPGPVYLRLGKRGEPTLYNSAKKFQIGKANILKKGNAIAVIATGNLVHMAVQTAELLAKKGLDITVVDMHTIKPIDKKCILQLTKTHSHIYTMEEHSIIGGLGSTVAEVIAEHRKRPALFFQRLGLPDMFFTTVGSQQYMRGIAGLSPEKISTQIAKEYKRYA